MLFWEPRNYCDSEDQKTTEYISKQCLVQMNVIQALPLSLSPIFQEDFFGGWKFRAANRENSGWKMIPKIPVVYKRLCKYILMTCTYILVYTIPSIQSTATSTATSQCRELPSYTVNSHQIPWNPCMYQVWLLLYSVYASICEFMRVQNILTKCAW